MLFKVLHVEIYRILVETEIYRVVKHFVHFTEAQINVEVEKIKENKGIDVLVLKLVFIIAVLEVGNMALDTT